MRHGNAVPDFNFTAETSDALIDPLTVTPVRKFAGATSNSWIERLLSLPAVVGESSLLANPFGVRSSAARC